MDEIREGDGRGVKNKERERTREKRRLGEKKMYFAEFPRVLEAF